MNNIQSRVIGSFFGLNTVSSFFFKFLLSKNGLLTTELSHSFGLSYKYFFFVSPVEHIVYIFGSLSQVNDLLSKHTRYRCVATWQLIGAVQIFWCQLTRVVVHFFYSVTLYSFSKQAEGTAGTLVT